VECLKDSREILEILEIARPLFLNHSNPETGKWTTIARRIASDFNCVDGVIRASRFPLLFGNREKGEELNDLYISNVQNEINYSLND